MGLRRWLGLKRPAEVQQGKHYLTQNSPLTKVFAELSGCPFTIIQIGAYVGTSHNDPLAAFLKNELSVDRGATAILVEPVAEYFAELRSNYKGLHGLKLENLAIAAEAGRRTFYRISVDPTQYGFPEYLAQLSSLREDRMTTLWDNYEGRWIDPKHREFYMLHRIAEQVECISFSDLVKRHDIEQIDFLQIDTEGYDYEILKSIDFEKRRPRFINYERTLLQSDEAACRSMMQRFGYTLEDWDIDTLCTRIDS
jgi:FkbM family methyltransferase